MMLPSHETFIEESRGQIRTLGERDGALRLRMRKAEKGCRDDKHHFIASATETEPEEVGESKNRERQETELVLQRDAREAEPILENLALGVEHNNLPIEIPQYHRSFIRHRLSYIYRIGKSWFRESRIHQWCRTSLGHLREMSRINGASVACRGRDCQDCNEEPGSCG